MKNVYLIQAEITSGYENNEHYLPFSVGCIWAYANQFEDIQQNFKLQDVIWRRDRQKDVLNKITDPHIVAFSTYVWNHQWNLTLAKKIKTAYPNCLIIFGGPSINEEWLKHEFIDVCMFGEGEEAWAKLLRMYLAEEEIPRYWHNPRQLSIENYPSPYTTGFFDKIIKDNPNVSWFMMIETNRGCPYHCTFCGWGADYLNKLKVFNISRAQEELDWAASNNIHWIFFIDANSGIFKERDVEIAWMARRAIETPESKIRRVTFNHAKNLNEHCFEIEKIIQEWTYGMEIAIQSMHEPTLEAAKRINMGLNNLERAYALCRKHGIRYYTELVLGLPLETKETYINGLMKLTELGQHDSVKTYLATVIPNSEMDSPKYLDKYGIKVIHPKDMYRSPEERIWDDEDQSHEVIAMVCETNSASRQDIADCLAYAWMMSQFHYSGYTQIVSKYLYYMKKIPYRKFYDHLYQVIKNDNIAGAMLLDVETILINYLKYGEVPTGDKWHNIVALTLSESYGGDKIFENKNYFISLGLEAAKELSEIEDSIVLLQYAFIKDNQTPYPFKVDSKIDIDRWEYTDCTYQILERVPVSHQQDQMYEKFLRKTDMNNITNTFIEKFVDNTYKGSRIPIIEIKSNVHTGMIY